MYFQDIPYLVSKESKGEEIAPKYKTEFSFNINEFVTKINEKYPEAALDASNISNDIEVLSRSEAGGVKEIRFGKKVVKGLEFRLAFGLSSTNFEISITADEVVFNCKRIWPWSWNEPMGCKCNGWGRRVMMKYLNIITLE